MLVSSVTEQKIKTNSLQKNVDLKIKNNCKTLILVPDLAVPGGVANYYNSLQLNAVNNISYFTINKQESNSKVSTTFRLLKNYLYFLLKLIKDRNELVVVNPSLYPRSFYRDFGFIFFSRLLKKRVVVFFHGWLDSFEEEIKNSKFKSFLFRISYAKVREFVVLGKIFKNKLINLGASSAANFYIETMVAGPKALSRVDLKEKKLSFEKEVIFLFLSRIEKEKGIYIAIDAFHEFAKKFPERKATLIVAGDGPDLSAVKLYVQEQEISNIQFLGHITGEDKRRVLQHSHVMLFPSYTEGLPNVILEGMLYGMPIISRATGAIPEIIHDGINGYLTESYNPGIFTGFLSLIALNVELYEEIGERNHKIALEKFLNENVKERFIKILKSNEKQL
jgi:glycosyltransferase involved in cell wall biosynthesis